MEQIQKADEIQIFKDLGLQNQVSMREVQTVMDGMPYYPVTMKALEKLFHIRMVKWLTFWHNYGVRMDQKPIATVLFSLLVIGIPVAVGVIAHFGGMAYIGLIFLILLLVISLAIWDIELRETRGVLKAEITVEEIGLTKVKIPYGAALRYKEAKDKGAFDSFAVVYPNVVEQQITRDPAIIGMKNGQMFMVVYWDLEKDKERVIRKLRDYRKFKV